ncbi:zinc finger protein 267-like isoform X2 [Calliphora vicina]|uniref:zinc finger protein 267-like isoform X2 n=1 Tax=Calliphora vicina TaxID=7373 RepID=UPI00325AB6A1
MKKNAKNGYSFNCWFCGTIYVQMKKFTLHLEKEHVTLLEQTTSIVSEHSNEENLDDKTEIQLDTAMDSSLFIGEIKIEDCDNDDIKSEIGDEKPQIVTRSHKKSRLSPTFQDPLETFESNANEISLTVPQENDEEIKVDENIDLKNEPPPLEDVEINNFSDDEQLDDSLNFSDEDNTTDSDFKIENSDDEKLMEPLKQSKKPKEKEYILALIEAYYKKSQLWNVSDSKKCSPKKRKILLQSITDELNVKLKTKLKSCTVNDKINLICKQYEKEIKRQLKKKEKNKDKKKVADSSELWFYENMSFLKSIVESKLKQKKRKTYHKVTPLTDDLLCEIIDIYKNYTSLWDVNHVAYLVRQKRDETLQSMVDDVIKKINISLDVDKLQKHLLHIHNSISKDKQLKLESEAKHLEFIPTCSFYYKCDFLEDHQGPFKCSYCSEIFIQHKDFKIHKFQHDGSIPFKCQECGMGFKTSGSYTVHVKRHLGVLRFRCEICGKGYPVNSELELHMRSHTGDQPYLCSICGEGFRAYIGYDNHMRRHEERFRHYCHICQKGFNTFVRLTDHVNAHLNVRDFICPVCGKSFTCKKYLNYHKRIHGSKNYTCNICGKSYAQDAGLRQHKKQHGTPIGISSINKAINQ